MVLADDDPRWKWDPVEQAEAACRGGAAVVQLRAKHATDRQCLRFAEAIRRETERAGVLFFVNDRFDLALLAGADGVHLGRGDLPVERLPAAARERLLLGASTHEPAHWAEAARLPLDYVAFGPVFGTESKASAYGARGLAALGEAVRAAAPRPLAAIGGIDRENVDAVAAAGARFAAVISAVAAADDPAAAVQELAAAFAADQ